MKTILQKNRTVNLAFACLATGLLSTVFIYFGVTILEDYGWTVFCLVPFFSGLTTTIITSYYEKLTIKRAIGNSLFAFFVCSVFLLIFAIEGIICILMAAPLAIPFIIAGTFVGYAIQNRKATRIKLIILYTIVVPSLLAFENHIDTKPTVYPIITSVEIDAPIEQVWANVIAFPEMEAPTEFLFKTGIAYPKNATIKGHGVGAIRYCNFSTGSFVEPITKWEAPTLLAFSVKEQPIPMKEISMYDINPAHLHEYFVSQKGQFKLIKISENKTLLEGTTWYYNKIQPEGYWQVWSKYIIHKIHNRVLLHIKKNSEHLKTE